MPEPPFLSRAATYHRRPSHGLTNTAYYHLFPDSSRVGTSDGSQHFAAKSPLADARAALDVLHNLCEQSGWLWIDGMLLGGCLHYGLERYELALEWFLRVIALDDRYVPKVRPTLAAPTLEH
jgi:hypothetical protein